MSSATLERNLAALAQKRPALASRLRSLPPDPRYQLRRSRSSMPTLCRIDATGAESLLHSAYHPLEEAKQMVKLQHPGVADAYLISGLGLGYHV